MTKGAILRRAGAALGLFCLLVFLTGCPQPGGSSSDSSENGSAENASEASGDEAAAGDESGTNPAEGTENAAESSQGSSDGSPQGSSDETSEGADGSSGSAGGAPDGSENGSPAGGSGDIGGNAGGVDVGGMAGTGGADGHGKSDAGSLPGLPGGSLPPSAASGTPTGSPRERAAAVAKAERALEDTGGSAASRYRKLLEAYQGLAPFVDQDAQCRGLAGRLLAEMNRIGGGVAPGPVPDVDKPLVAE
ncbi:MAG: hypothetical protein D6741_21350 [Planctomycetota bacterium]|nr:MAG: hypothetical protein D6741_21350 [Planctomycetota bacterium]